MVLESWPPLLDSNRKRGIEQIVGRVVGLIVVGAKRKLERVHDGVHVESRLERENDDTPRECCLAFCLYCLVCSV